MSAWPATKFDVFEVTKKLLGLPGGESLRLKALDTAFAVMIPFNRWLGLRFETISADMVVIASPPRTLRKNHVGTAHACAQALMGEYAAGILVAQHYSMQDFRFIIGNLSIDYHKPGKGLLKATALKPEILPAREEETFWVEMLTKITNEKGDLVSECRTKWQVKSWKLIDQEKRGNIRDVTA